MEQVKAGFVLRGEALLKGIRNGIIGDPRSNRGLTAIKDPLGFQDNVKTSVAAMGQMGPICEVARGQAWDMALLLARKNTMLSNEESAAYIGRVGAAAVGSLVLGRD
jgi:hypothetical protein